MKKKATVKRKASKNKPVKKGPPCIYCGATVYTGVDICSNCHKKKTWCIGFGSSDRRCLLMPED